MDFSIEVFLFIIMIELFFIGLNTIPKLVKWIIGIAIILSLLGWGFNVVWPSIL